MRLNSQKNNRKKVLEKEQLKEEQVMKKSSKIIVMLLAITLGISTLVSCSAKKESDATLSKPADATSSVGSEVTTVAGKSLAGKKIGVSLYYKGDSWYVNVDKEFKSQGEALGAEMVVQDANGIPETQKSQLENFAIQKCDMIMFCAVDPVGVAATLDDLSSKKIPMVGFDEPPIWDGLVSFVAWDNYQSGFDMGQYVRKYIDENKDGKANIVIMELAQSPLCMSRAEGFEKGLGDLGQDIKIVARQDPENNEEKATNMISNIKEPFDIVFAVTDPGAFGAATALEAMKAKDVQVFSCGGYGEKTYDMLKDNNPYYKAVVVIPPSEMVKAIMNVAEDYFSGKSSEIPAQVNCDYIIADSSNFESIKP